MNKILLFSLTACLPLLFSCKKEIEVVVEVKQEVLLVNKNWKIKEITFVEDNILYYYLRGGINNSVDFSNNNIFFDEDGSGLYSDEGSTYEIAWELNEIDKSKLKYTIFNYYKGSPQPGYNSLVELENVNVTTGNLKYAEIYSQNNERSVISSVHRFSTTVK